MVDEKRSKNRNMLLEKLINKSDRRDRKISKYENNIQR